MYSNDPKLTLAGFVSKLARLLGETATEVQPRMGPRMLELKCPQCGRGYTICPRPEVFLQIVQTRRFLMECEFCEKELEFGLSSLEKKPAYF